MTTYVMEALENYDPATVALLDVGTFSGPGYAFVDNQNVAMGIDYVNRVLWMPMVKATDAQVTNGVNDSGFTIWDGLISIAPGGALDYTNGFNLYLLAKNLDTGAVTAHDAWSAANLVPASAAGDGTWRRFVNDTSNQGGNTVLLVNPHNGNLYIHTESCQVYLFKPSQDYAQTLSPYRPNFNVNDMVYPIGCTADWIYAWEYELRESPQLSVMHLIPADITGEEVTQDKLLSYADFDYPPGTEAMAFRHCMDTAKNLYVFGWNETGPRSYKLWRFSPPTSAPWGGPVVGGGFTDITPWDSTHGPNADATPYIHATFTYYSNVNGTGPAYKAIDSNKAVLQYLPATDTVVAISKYFAIDELAAAPDPFAGDPAKTLFSCTYVTNASSGLPGFEYHSAFVAGYMNADWTAGDSLTAAWVVLDCYEDNRFLGMSDHNYGVDYTKRWFVFRVYAKAAYESAVDDTKLQNLYVQYQFTVGAAPAVVQIINGSNWDSSASASYYRAQSALTGYASPLAAAMTETVDIHTASTDLFGNNSDAYAADGVFYDYATGDFWWSGAPGRREESAVFFNFSAYYQARLAGNSTQNLSQPLLRLSTPAPIPIFANSFVRSFVGNPQL